MRASPIPKSRRGLPISGKPHFPARPPTSVGTSPTKTEKWAKVIKSAGIKAD